MPLRLVRVRLPFSERTAFAESKGQRLNGISPFYLVDFDLHFDVFYVCLGIETPEEHSAKRGMNKVLRQGLDI